MDITRAVLGITAVLLFGNIVFLVGFSIFKTMRGAIGCVVSSIVVIGLHTAFPAVFGAAYLWAVVWTIAFGMMYLLFVHRHKA